MTGKVMLIAAVLAVAIAASAAGVFFLNQHSDDVPPADPADTEPDIPVPVVPEPQYPEGISYDPDTKTLSSEMSVTWEITDELAAFVDKHTETVEGTEVVLEDGFYAVGVSGEIFGIVVGDTVTKSFSWEYLTGGEKIPLTVTCEIDLGELAGIMTANRAWNDGKNNNRFSNLTDIVYVNDTVRSVADQITKQYLDNGGSLSDRQSYADILASFAQVAIEYPPWEKIPKTKTTSSDYHYWGVDEYWANPLETLYFGKGDCEDTSAMACALFKAAGFESAMVGGPRHVMAAVALDTFEERDLAAYNIRGSFGLAVSTDAHRVTDNSHTFYGVETIKGQTPVGYLMKGQLSHINSNNSRDYNCEQGVAGYYVVA